MNRRCRSSIADCRHRRAIRTWSSPNHAFRAGFRPLSDNPVWNEFYVAVDSSVAGTSVRGAYGLKQEALFIRGKGVQRIACYHHPLSEGIVDRQFTSVGMLLGARRAGATALSIRTWNGRSGNSDCADAEGTWLHPDSDSVLFPCCASRNVSATDACAARDSLARYIDGPCGCDWNWMAGDQ